MQRQNGEYVTSTAGGEQYQAYIPAPLPPSPPIEMSGDLFESLEKANHALGRLDGMVEVLPDINLFIYHYVRKEALLSSQIEGSQSSYSDLLLYEMDAAPGVPVEDVEEVSNYIATLNRSLQKLRDGFPLSLTRIRDIHKVLLSGSRGTNKQAGEFRQGQNWLGGTGPGNAIYVPPPPERLKECLDPLIEFMNNDTVKMPILIRTGLVHAQFETIHPFLDGNGRVGRLLISLLLCHHQLLKEPMLYLSLYFKQNRSEYYNQLQQVRLKGNWEQWLLFYLHGIHNTANEAVDTVIKLRELFTTDKERIKKIGRISQSCLKLHQLLINEGIINIQDASKELEINRTTIANCIKHLLELGIIREITGYRRNRYFVYDQYVNELSKGTDPL